MSFWKDVGEFVGRAAPALGTALGGPVGGVIGAGLSALLGVEDDPEAVLNELKQNPEALVKLKKYEMDHEKELKRLDIKEQEIYLQDRQSARERESRVVEATGEKDYALYILASTLVVGFFAVLVVFMVEDIKGNEALYLLLGSLASGFGAVIQYFFGSSRGSKDKDRAIERIVQK